MVNSNSLDVFRTIGPTIGKGQTASVHAWGQHHVLKLFNAGVVRSEVEAEARATRVANALDVHAPAVGEILEFDDSLGLVFELVPGTPMLELLLSAPENAQSLATLLAELHALIHSRSAPPSMPMQRRLLRIKVERADLPDDLYVFVLRELAVMPDESSLCHGDFHPANVMLDGEQHTVVDWNDASRGSPAMDVARTSAVMLGAALEDPQLKPFSEAIAEFHSTYLDRYFAISPSLRDQYKRCLPLAAASRMCEVSGAAKPWLRQLVERYKRRSD